MYAFNLGDTEEGGELADDVVFLDEVGVGFLFDGLSGGRCTSFRVLRSMCRRELGMYLD